MQVLVARAIRAKGLIDEACDVLERRRAVVLYDAETDALRVQDRGTLGKMIVHNFIQNYGIIDGAEGLNVSNVQSMTIKQCELLIRLYMAKGFFITPFVYEYITSEFSIVKEALPEVVFDDDLKNLLEDYQRITWSPYHDSKSRVNNSVGKLVYKTSAIKKQKAKENLLIVRDANSEKRKKKPVSILENTKRKNRNNYKLCQRPP